MKVFASLALGTILLASAAQAETVRLAVRNLNDTSEEKIIDIPDACGLKAINIGVQGGTFWLWDMTVSYRSPQLKREKFHVNKALRNSATGWIPLKGKANGLCVRRLYLELEASGPSNNATVSVFGSR